MKYIKIFEKFIDGSEYDQYEIVYSTEQTNDNGESLGIVEFDYENYQKRPFRCLIWDNDDKDYNSYSGEISEDDAKDAVNLEVYRLYGYDEDEDEN